MQGRGLIERLIEGVEGAEEIAFPSADRWTVEGATQGEREEAGDREDLDREQALPVEIELFARAADAKGERVEDVRRPIGQDRPADEGYVAFPREHERGDVRAMAGCGVGEVVGQKEKRSEE